MTLFLQAVADGRLVVVDLKSGDGQGFAVFDAVRDEVIRLEMALIRVEHRRHQLEDLFRAGGGDERAA